MPSGNAPTVRQRRIGSAFRKARDRHNLTVATVARRGRSQGWMSMVENGLQFISADELNDLLDFYAIEDGPLRESLLHLATHTLGTWARAYEYRISAALDLASLEEDSAEIRSFEPSIVPGLLQIPEYARKIIAIGNAKHPHDVRTLVDFRMSRQRALSQPSPPRFVALIAGPSSTIRSDAIPQFASADSTAGRKRPSRPRGTPHPAQHGQRVPRTHHLIASSFSTSTWTTHRVRGRPPDRKHLCGR